MSRALSRYIAAELGRRHWTQSKLANRMDCGPATITELIKYPDLTGIRFATLDKMCAALDLSLAHLLNGIALAAAELELDYDGRYLESAQVAVVAGRSGRVGYVRTGKGAGTAAAEGGVRGRLLKRKREAAEAKGLARAPRRDDEPSGPVPTPRGRRGEGRGRT